MFNSVSPGKPLITYTSIRTQALEQLPGLDGSEPVLPTSQGHHILLQNFSQSHPVTWLASTVNSNSGNPHLAEIENRPMKAIDLKHWDQPPSSASVSFEKSVYSTKLKLEITNQDDPRTSKKTLWQYLAAVLSAISSKMRRFCPIILAMGVQYCDLDWGDKSWMKCQWILQLSDCFCFNCIFSTVHPLE